MTSESQPLICVPREKDRPAQVQIPALPLYAPQPIPPPPDESRILEAPRADADLT
jgi:hypothetical protein